MTKLGLLTPVVSILPRAHGDWEEGAGVAELTDIARAADRLGYHHLTCSEHLAIPSRHTAARGSRYWSPAVTLSYLAAVTTRIRLTTYVVVLPYHHPLELLKTYGTLDQVSQGRVILGVGIGSLRSEFAALGANFEERAAVSEDAMRALRQGFSSDTPAYSGRFFKFEGLVVDPSARQARLPLWVGGNTARSLRRAVLLGDGWMPFGLSLTQLGEMIERTKCSTAYGQRSEALEVVLAPDKSLDPILEPQVALAAVAELEQVGATIVNVRVRAESASHCVEQLIALAELLGLPPESTA